MTMQTRGSSVPQLLERDVETPNGRVFVTEMPGEDPPIVLLHGFPDDHRIYSELMARLSPRRAVAFDFVGYGRSERKDGAHFSPEDHGAEHAGLTPETPRSAINPVGRRMDHPG